MKTLILLRHAKSACGDSDARDFDRPLSPKGRVAARTIGRELRARGVGFDAVMASPALRVVETVADVGEGYGSRIRPVYDERLYLASAAVLLEVIRGIDDRADRLLLIGHNPGLERLAMLLTRDGGNALRREVEAKYPTATVAEIRLPVERWSDVEPASGCLESFIRPRDLDPALGPDRDAY